MSSLWALFSQESINLMGQTQSFFPYICDPSLKLTFLRCRVFRGRFVGQLSTSLSINRSVPGVWVSGIFTVFCQMLSVVHSPSGVHLASFQSTPSELAHKSEDSAISRAESELGLRLRKIHRLPLGHLWTPWALPSPLTRFRFGLSY